MKVSENTKMASVVHNNHDNLMVINRFGIPLGFGDKSVKEVCNEQGVSLPLFLAICNDEIEDYKNNGHQQTDQKMLLQFLKNSHNYYRSLYLPEIKVKLENLASHYPDNIRMALTHFYNEYEKEVIAHLDKEEKMNFKSKHTHLHEDIEQRLSDLKNIIIKYMDRPEHDLQKIDLLDRLFHFQDDLNRHAKIEDALL